MENELFKPLNLLADIQIMVSKKDFNTVFIGKEKVKLIHKMIIEKDSLLLFPNLDFFLMLRVWSSLDFIFNT